MRIVYDDTYQKELVDLVDGFLAGVNISYFVRKRDNKIDRTQFKESLNEFLNIRSFNIGNKATHAHGIGNNCNYPVYYTNKNNKDELQHCANININSGLHGELYISCEDYNGSRVSHVYTLSEWGIKRSYFG